MDSETITFIAKGSYWPVEPRRAWLRGSLAFQLWTWKLGTGKGNIRWTLLFSLRMNCPLIIYRLEVEPAEGVEDGHDGQS